MNECCFVLLNGWAPKAASDYFTMDPALHGLFTCSKTSTTPKGTHFCPIWHYLALGVLFPCMATCYVAEAGSAATSFTHCHFLCSAYTTGQGQHRVILAWAATLSLHLSSSPSHREPMLRGPSTFSSAWLNQFCAAELATCHTLDTTEAWLHAPVRFWTLSPGGLVGRSVPFFVTACIGKFPEKNCPCEGLALTM